jgi:hypothetical protein
LELSDTLLFYRNKNLDINEELDGGEFVWVGAELTMKNSSLFLSNSLNDINWNAFERCLAMLAAINCVGSRDIVLGGERIIF